MKKSFILHIDSLGILKELTDEQAGQLFKIIANYHNPQEPKITEITQVVSLAFYQFKTQFERDIQTYENIVERNKKNGNKGGRPKKGNPSKPKKADSDSDSDSDSKKDSNSKNDIKRKKDIFIEKMKTELSEETDVALKNVFFLYWTELNKSETKMRFEEQRYFEIKKRFATFKKNKPKEFASGAAENKPLTTPKPAPTT